MKHAERQPPPTVSAVSPQGVQLPVWNSELLRKYEGCSYASGDVDVTKNAIIMSSAQFMALRVSGTGV